MILSLNCHCNFTTLLTTIFLCYTAYSVFTLYTIFQPSECPIKDDQHCLNPAFGPEDEFQLFLCTSSSSHPLAEKLKCFYHNETWRLGNAMDLDFNITLPKKTLNNGTLVLTVVLTKLKSSQFPDEAMLTSRHTITTQAYLTKYQPKKDKMYNLLTSESSTSGSKKSNLRPETHWKSRLVLNSLYQQFSMSRDNLPKEIMHLIQLDSKKQYMPIVYVSDVRQRAEDVRELPEKTTAKAVKMPLHIVYEPITIGRLRFTLVMETSLRTIKRLGFSEKEIEDVKSIFFDTNHWMLLTTIIIVMLHTLFDFLAFKNDIQFWRSRETMEGISVNTIIYRFISSLIITLYLVEKRSSLLVTLPLGIGTLIEMWKMSKVWHIRWVGWFQFERAQVQKTELEEKTAQYDSQTIRFLSVWVLPPLLVGGAAYSVMYVEHRSWYSWAIESLANGVYAFGFIAMLPQLFINYRLKSVAHLPWRVFMYKAFNTFIDDFFAFLITSLPTTHRLATFRDDIIFLIYLYQRWLYPIDHNRSVEGVRGTATAVDVAAADIEASDSEDEDSRKRR